MVDKIKASLNTLTPGKAKMGEQTRMIFDGAMVIPIYYISEACILQSNVHDTGYFELEAGTIYKP